MRTQINGRTQLLLVSSQPSIGQGSKNMGGGKGGRSLGENSLLGHKGQKWMQTVTCIRYAEEHLWRHTEDLKPMRCRCMPVASEQETDAIVTTVYRSCNKAVAPFALLPCWLWKNTAVLFCSVSILTAFAPNEYVRKYAFCIWGRAGRFLTGDVMCTHRRWHRSFKLCRDLWKDAVFSWKMCKRQILKLYTKWQVGNVRGTYTV